MERKRSREVGPTARSAALIFSLGTVSFLGACSPKNTIKTPPKLEIAQQTEVENHLAALVSYDIRNKIPLNFTAVIAECTQRIEPVYIQAPFLETGSDGQVYYVGWYQQTTDGPAQYAAWPESDCRTYGEPDPPMANSGQPVTEGQVIYPHATDQPPNLFDAVDPSTSKPYQNMYHEPTMIGIEFVPQH